MIWVLFLIFRETGHEALAKFNTADECKVEMAELREAYRRNKTPRHIPGFLVMNAFQRLKISEGANAPHHYQLRLNEVLDSCRVGHNALNVR